MYVYHLLHYFSILFYCEAYKRAIGFGKIKSRITCFNKHAQFFFMKRKNEQAKSIFRQSAILLARDNSKIFCVNWAHKKIFYNGNWKFSYRVSKITMLRLYNSYQQFSIFKNFRYLFVHFPLNQLKKKHTFKVDVLNWKVDLHIHTYYKIEHKTIFHVNISV